MEDNNQSKVITDEDETVLVVDLKILEIWREHYHKLVNEENPRKGSNEHK